MTVIASDGLSVLMGDGGSPQVFHPLRGVTVSRLDIHQRVMDSTAVNGTGWLSGMGAMERRAVIECEGAATDEAAAIRLRSVAMSGEATKVRLNVSASQTVEFLAYVTRYRETMRAGDIKRVTCQLESSGSVSLI